MNPRKPDPSHKSFSRDTSGNTTVIMALALVVMLGAAGVAIDFVNTSDRQTSMQAAIDAAALAGVREEGADSSRIAAAQASFAANTKGLDFDFSKPEFTFSDNSTKLAGKVSFKSSGSFVALLGVKPNNMAVNATAIYEAASPAACIHALNASASSALIFNNKRGPLNFTGPSIDAPKCGVQVNSSSNSALLVKEATGYSFLNYCIVGGIAGASSSLSPTPDASCKQPLPDPFSGMGAPAASGSCLSGGSSSLSPGRYCSGLNASGSTVSFAPGIYIVESGDLVVNASSGLDANGVTFVMAPGAGSISIQSGGVLNLTAPAGGPTANFIVIDRTGRGEDHLIKTTIRDGSWMSLNGMIYAPEDHMEIFWQRGGVGSNERPLQWENFGVIANTIDLHGYNQLFIEPSKLLETGGAERGVARLDD